MNNAAVLLAGGSSRRMAESGRNEKKEFIQIDGKPLLLWSLDTLIHTGIFSQIVIVCNNSYLSTLKDLLNGHIKTPGECHLITVPGGDTRKQSVMAGLEALTETQPDYVFIHDGARPYVSESLIMNLYEAVQEFKAAIPVIPSVNAMKRIDRRGFIVEHLVRDETVAAQTPQAFSYTGILEAHRSTSGKYENFIDDAQVWSAGGWSDPHSIPGSLENIKITYSSDLE